MLEDSINVNNFCCNPVALKKKKVKPLKINFWAPVCTTKGSAWPMPKMAEIKKADDQLLETFYFIKISYVLAEYDFLSILCDFFHPKRFISN